MTTIKTLISTVALLAASTVFAQTGNSPWFPTSTEDGQGTIGRRYGEGYLSLQDVSGSSKNIYGGGVAANVPLLKGIDLNGRVGYTSFKPAYASTTLTNLDGAVKFYNQSDADIKAFIAPGLGVTFGDVNDHSTSWVRWNVAIGAEFAYKWVAITPTLTYNDDFRHHGPSQQSISYGAEFSSWATPQVNVFAKVEAIDPFHDANITPGLTIGLRVRF
ncbi:MAG: hypothetical protein QM790_12535 [Nibricoccus sp.]